MLRADGTLRARGHIADTTQMGLENVSGDAGDDRLSGGRL